VYDQAAILRAIHDKWAASAELAAGIAEVSYAEVPRTTLLPSASLLIIGGTTDRILMGAGPKSLEDVMVQFSVFEGSRGIGPIAALVHLLTEAFDHAALTFSGGEYRGITMLREGVPIMEFLSGSWRAAVTYRLMVQEG